MNEEDLHVKMSREFYLDVCEFAEKYTYENNVKISGFIIYAILISLDLGFTKPKFLGYISNIWEKAEDFKEACNAGLSEDP